MRSVYMYAMDFRIVAFLVFLCVAVPLPIDGILQSTTAVPHALPIKNITAPMGQNVTVKFQAPDDNVNFAVNVTRPGQNGTFVLYYRNRLIDPDHQDPLYKKHAWLVGCSNVKDCKNLSLILLIDNSTYYGTYNIYIKVKDAEGNIKKKLISIVILMPDDLTASPNAKTLTAVNTTAVNSTAANSTAEMSPGEIAGIISALVLVLVLVLVGVYYLVKKPDQRGDNPAGEYELQALNVRPHEENGDTKSREKEGE